MMRVSWGLLGSLQIATGGVVFALPFQIVTSSPSSRRSDKQINRAFSPYSKIPYDLFRMWDSEGLPALFIIEFICHRTSFRLPMTQVDKQSIGHSMTDYVGYDDQSTLWWSLIVMVAISFDCLCVGFGLSFGIATLPCGTQSATTVSDEVARKMLGKGKWYGGRESQMFREWMTPSVLSSLS